MKIEKNYDLSKSTTFHIGGIARNYYIPNSEEELINLLKTYLINEERIYIISGGSNILINDKKIFDNVISAKNIDEKIEKIEKGKYYIGCSARIQKVIKTINRDGYGGFEELVSLPALFGGIIYMNAGIGSKNDSLFTISDFIEKVKVIEYSTKEIKWLDKDECNFSHRYSIFHNNNYFILGAKIKVNEQEEEKSKKRIMERLEKSKKYDRGKGCFGTCFSEANNKLLHIVSFIYRRKGSIRFAKNNKNWLVNDGKGTFDDTMYIIKKCKKIHKAFHRKITCEVIVWS